MRVPWTSRAKRTTFSFFVQEKRQHQVSACSRPVQKTHTRHETRVRDRSKRKHSKKGQSCSSFLLIFFGWPLFVETLVHRANDAGIAIFPFWSHPSTGVRHFLELWDPQPEGNFQLQDGHCAQILSLNVLLATVFFFFFRPVSFGSLGRSMTMTMTMTHSGSVNQHQSAAWPYSKRST